MNPGDVRLEEIKRHLFLNAMKSQWGKVMEACRKNREVHTAKITSSGDTALHIAISSGADKSVVQKLVEIVSETEGALAAANDLGDTPLHLAIYLGNANMCRFIAEACTPELFSTLMGIRNGDNETPFFLAVHHGRRDAFNALRSILGDEGYKFCRGEAGVTILHSAIDGEYFDLAFDIATFYPKLVTAVNEDGFSPLHILANKPSAFRSGSQIRDLDKLIYPCILIGEPVDNQVADLQYKNEAQYPENYHPCRCRTTFKLLWRIIRVLLMGLCGSKNAPFEVLEDGTYVRHKTTSFSSNYTIRERSRKRNAQRNEFLPKNYNTLANFIRLIMSKVVLPILALCTTSVEKIREKKSKHIWSVRVMEKLLQHTSLYQYENNGMSPTPRWGKDTQIPSNVPDMNDQPATATDVEKVLEAVAKTITDHHAVSVVDSAERRRSAMHYNSKVETPILMAAMNGVVEMVDGILEMIPVAIEDTNYEDKNVVLIAVEHRQAHMYEFLLRSKRIIRNIVFRKIDVNGNSALHIAASGLGKYRPLNIPGAALQMQWEIKWFEFVRDSMPIDFFPKYNYNKKTPRDIFTETHHQLIEDGNAWLTTTSQSCSVVGGLIVTVAYPTFATLPGGVKSDNSGTPALQTHPAFSIFAISTLVSLYFSVTSVVLFLAILTSRFQEKDFREALPRRLLLALTTLYISIGSTLLSFCVAHFFILEKKLRYAVFPMYAIMCLPVAFHALEKFPLYVDLVLAASRKIPHRSSK